MRNGFFLLAISTFVAALAWIATGSALVVFPVGVVTFLFSLLGDICHASDAYIGDTYGRDGEHG